MGLRVFAFDVDDVVGHLVNPVLDFPDEEEQDGPEGCLSIPGIYIDTKRRQNVVATGFNEHGEPVQIVGTGLMARCVQHETDHLDGVLFLDRLDAGSAQGGDGADPRGAVVRPGRAARGQGEPARRRTADSAEATVRLVFAGTPEVALPALRRDRTRRGTSWSPW